MPQKSIQTGIPTQLICFDLSSRGNNFLLADKNCLMLSTHSGCDLMNALKIPYSIFTVWMALHSYFPHFIHISDHQIITSGETTGKKANLTEYMVSNFNNAPNTVEWTDSKYSNHL